MSDILILKPAVKLEGRTHITRSFSYKLNCANYNGPQYESRDFFCSESSECSVEDAAEVSALLYSFCKRQVMESVREYIRDMREQQQQRRAG